MRYARVGEPGHEKPVLVEGNSYFDLSGVAPDIRADFFDPQTQERIRAAHASGTLPRLVAGSARIGAPIPRPGGIVCVGMNYAAHAAESGSPPPEHMVIFHKLPNTLAGPFDDVTVPPGSKQLDWEVELGIVIGREATYLADEAEASECIGGFVVVNDLSERQWQIELSGGQWGKGKSGPGFSPVGPYLVTPDEVDPGNLRLRSWVNGDIRQDSNTSDLIFPVPYIVWHLSQFMVLEPGDLILTGTPEGVALSGRFPYLQRGDVMEFEVDGLGRQRQVLV